METKLISYTLVFLSIIKLSKLCPDKCLCTNENNLIVRNHPTYATCVDISLNDVPIGISSSVKYLNLSRNSITILSKSVIRETILNVVSLNLSRNLIKIVEMGALSPLTKLKYFDISYNQLTILDQTFLSNEQPAIIELDISNNKLTSLDGAFQSMNDLIKLDLKNNLIKSLSEYVFRDLIKLKYLYLSNNEINYINKNAFKNMNSLLNLVLKNNPLDSVTQLNLYSNYLSYLDLSECKLKRIPQGLSNNLKYLQLRKNNIEEIKNNDLLNYPKLNILLLDNNKIKFVQNESFTKLKTLQQLWLNDNDLDEIPENIPSSVQRFLLDNNKISDFNIKSFHLNSSITTLSLSGNLISTIQPNFFHSFSNLYTLDLSNNRINELPSDMLITNTKLSSLNLNKNSLAILDAKCFEKLEHLKILSMNYIENSNIMINGGILNNLKSLKILNLDYSPSLIKYFIPELIKSGSIIKLNELSAEHSNLNRLFFEGTRQLFDSINTVQISSNKWHCDENIKWLKNWLIKKKRFNSNNICFSPKHLQGTSLISLEDFLFEISTSIPKWNFSYVLTNKLTANTKDDSIINPISDLSRNLGRTSTKTYTNFNKLSMNTQMNFVEKTMKIKIEKIEKSLNEDYIKIEASTFYFQNERFLHFNNNTSETTRTFDNELRLLYMNETKEFKPSFYDIVEIEDFVENISIENNMFNVENDEENLKTKNELKFERFFRPIKDSIHTSVSEISDKNKNINEGFNNNQLIPKKQIFLNHQENSNSENHFRLGNIVQPLDINPESKSGWRRFFSKQALEKQSTIALIISAVIIIATMAIASVMIFFIVFLLKKNKKKDNETKHLKLHSCENKSTLITTNCPNGVCNIESDFSESHSNQTIIKYKNKNGVLYFSTVNPQTKNGNKLGLSESSGQMHNNNCSRNNLQPNLKSSLSHYQHLMQDNASYETDSKRSSEEDIKKSCHTINSNNTDSNIKAKIYKWEDT